MPINALSPGFIRMVYSSPDTEEHVQTLQASTPATTPTPGTEPEFYLRDGVATTTFSTFAAEYASQVLPLLPTTATISRMEYWYKPTITSDPLYIYTHPVDLNGTGYTPGIRARQYAMTFRSIGGGLLRFVLLGISGSYADRDKPPYADNVSNDLSDYLTGNAPLYPNSIIQARDNTWPLLSLALTTKTNDVLRAKYLDL